MNMLERDAVIRKHDGCPNRHHCHKDETKCAYLVKGNCYLDSKEIGDYL
jgi:hypothetical protein